MTPIWLAFCQINSFGQGTDWKGSPLGPERNAAAPATHDSFPKNSSFPALSSRFRRIWTQASRPVLQFVRSGLGHFMRGMKMTHVRSKKPMTIQPIR